MKYLLYNNIWLTKKLRLEVGLIVLYIHIERSCGGRLLIEGKERTGVKHVTIVRVGQSMK